MKLVEFFGGRTLGTRKKKAYRWICKQRKRGRVRVIGVAQRRDTVRLRADELDRIDDLNHRDQPPEDKWAER